MWLSFDIALLLAVPIIVLCMVLSGILFVGTTYRVNIVCGGDEDATAEKPRGLK